MDLKKIILNNLTVSEIEDLLKEKREMVKSPVPISADCAVKNFLLKNVLKYKNPKIFMA